MEKLTKSEAIQKHRDMWNWIAEQIDEEQEVHSISCLKRYYILNNVLGSIENDCFLCEYSYQNASKFCARNCIVVWNRENCSSSEYEDCCEAKTWQEQYQLALKIANIQERKFEDESI